MEPLWRIKISKYLAVLPVCVPNVLAHSQKWSNIFIEDEDIIKCVLGTFWIMFKQYCLCWVWITDQKGREQNQDKYRSLFVSCIMNNLDSVGICRIFIYHRRMFIDKE